MSDCKRSILILCEGQEEWHYIKKLLSFRFYNSDLYSFAEPINVKGNENLFPRFQNEYNKNRYDIILLFCDGDNNSIQFQNIKKQIDENVFGASGMADKITIFVNPVTLQVVLSHFDDVKLTHKSKRINAEIVEKITGIKDYDARQEQIRDIVNQIHFSSLSSFKKRLQNTSSNPSDIPSTNLLLFLERFEGDDSSWIDEINRLLE